MNLCCFNCNSSDDDDNQGLLDPNQPPPMATTSVSDNLILNVDVMNSNSVPTPGGGGGHGGPEADDELAKILQETAAAMIDVSASGTSHASLDQREFQERTRAYLHKLQALGQIGGIGGMSGGGGGGSSCLLEPSTKVALLADVPNPEKVLNGPLISDEDLDLMEWALGEISSALNNIRVEADEELVVPFGV